MQQGIGQMDSVGDAPLQNVTIAGNDVEVTGFHSITITATVDEPSKTIITNNRVRQTTGRRAPIRAPANAFVCGNDVQEKRDLGGLPCD
jgi:hypothetical protein